MIERKIIIAMLSRTNARNLTQKPTYLNCSDDWLLASVLTQLVTITYLTMVLAATLTRPLSKIAALKIAVLKIAEKHSLSL